MQELPSNVKKYYLVFISRIVTLEYSRTDFPNLISPRSPFSLDKILQNRIKILTYN